MTSAESPIVPRLLQGEGPHHRALLVASAGFAEPAVHQRGHEPVRAHLPRATAADVSKWPGRSRQRHRAADTQKCIRAGGKHNDLEDVGLDTYHHTFFEMLGNWSFRRLLQERSDRLGLGADGEVWKFPAQRLYATVYPPGQAKANPSEFDQEAYDLGPRMFRAPASTRPFTSFDGNKKDNFWMMGDTGPCGPCSEIHVDLTPDGDTKGSLVNKGDARCIEIWNLVFIQFNANPDGTFSPLPAQHVDTGMGFERVTGIIQGTKGFTDFSRVISNYETDIFRPIFDELEKLSGKKYGSTLPARVPKHAKQLTVNHDDKIPIDIAFRVIADHIRTLELRHRGRHSSLRTRSQLCSAPHFTPRRALRAHLGFHEPFFFKLVDVLAATDGRCVSGIAANKSKVIETIRREEEAFNRTLDRGLNFSTMRSESSTLPHMQTANNGTSMLRENLRTR